jgi:hypothetical protein
MQVCEEVHRDVLHIGRHKCLLGTNTVAYFYGLIVTKKTKYQRTIMIFVNMF